MLKIYFYKLFLRAMFLANKVLDLKMRGLGWAADWVGVQFKFMFRDGEYVFVPQAARSYCLLPIGRPNEPETHLFLSRLLDEAKAPDIVFVDVGASVGEFVIPISLSERVLKVVAYEPHPASFEALRSSVSLNIGRGAPIHLRNVAISDTAGHASFVLSDRAPMAAHISNISDSAVMSTVPVTTLDHERVFGAGDLGIILIDVEGGEINAVRGAKATIDAFLPIIIFEFNDTTRRYFQLSDMQKVLGDTYRLFRLRSDDGSLDQDMDTTWNVVAMPTAGGWAHLMQSSKLYHDGKC